MSAYLEICATHRSQKIIKTDNSG